MQISTLLFQIKKMVGVKRGEDVSNQIVNGISESYEPSEQSVKNIMAFSKAYRHDKSDAIGDIDYIVN